MLGYIDPGQRLIAIVDNDAMRISLLEVESGAILHVFPVEHRCYGVAFSDDSAVLIVQEFDRTVFPETYYYAQWDILTGTRLDSIRDDSFTRLILTTALHWQLVSLEKWSDFARLRTQLLSDGKLIVAAVKGTELWQYPSHLLHTFPRSYVWFIPSDERFILLARPENTVERWSLETGELLHTYRVDTPHPQRLAFPSDEFYFTRNNLWHGPGGYYLTGEAEGSHSTPKLDLAVDQRYAAIPYDPTHTHPYAAKEAILFDIQEDPPRPVASVAYGGELLAQRFTPEHVLQLNTAGEIYRSRLPGVPQPE